MSLTDATRKKLQRVTDRDGVLVLLELNHSSFSEPARLVADTRDHTIGGIEYIGLPFTFKLPQDKSKEMPRAQLEIDNVGRELTAELERLPPGASLEATVRVVHRSTPTVVDFEFVAPLTSVRATMASITASMGPDDIMREPAVRIRFDQRTAPGLFPG